MNNPAESLSTDRRRIFFLAGLAMAWRLAGGGVAFAEETAAGESRGAWQRVLSCNIRVDLPEDAARGLGWKDRQEICAEIVRGQRPDLIAFQEVLGNQMADLRAALAEFDAFGFAGPEMDAHPTGYHGIAKNPIFYRRDRYELVAAGTYWLSETPTIGGSLSWGTARARHANWVRLRDRRTQREFRLVNTHLDHKSQPAREKQIAMILAECGQYAPDFPQLLCGDLNARMTNPVVEAIVDSGWTDAWVALHGPEDPGFTAHGFDVAARAALGDRAGKIDYTFIRGPIRAMESEIVRDAVEGRYPSDHYFLLTGVEL
ncbi:MAG: endonuclease/exonuclease/phosphatase family protein [Pirellulales bacterium]|nr:endonuclease/exonuclease/phosphatase family protein [Pirellulales bacterium]